MEELRPTPILRGKVAKRFYKHMDGNRIKVLEYPMIPKNGKVLCRFCGGERTHRNNCKYIVRIAIMGSDKFQKLSDVEKRKVMDEINELKDQLG